MIYVEDDIFLLLVFIYIFSEEIQYCLNISQIVICFDLCDISLIFFIDLLMEFLVCGLFFLVEIELINVDFCWEWYMF